MPVTVRLKKEQQKELTAKYMEINKKLINNGVRPVNESDLIHIIIDEGLKRVSVDKMNRIFLETAQEYQV